MKIKIIKSDFDRKTGISTVIIQTNLGKFIGLSKLHEEDKPYESSFAGCQYAEMRAIIKYMKARIQKISNEIIGLEKGIKMLMNLKDYNKDSLENRKLRKQLYIMKQEKKDWEERLKSLSDRLYKKMNERVAFIKRIEKEKEK